MSGMTVRVKGLDEARAAFAQAPQQMKDVWQAAAEETALEILDTPGLNRYPPQPRAYAPPYPFYIRGRGTQTSAGRNRGESQRLGSQNLGGWSGEAWTLEANPEEFRARIGNRASYARYVIGEKQSRRMAAIGWRKALEVAEEKLPEIAGIIERWLAYGLRQAGLDVKE